MIVIILLIIAALGVTVALLCLGYLLGYNTKNIQERLQELELPLHRDTDSNDSAVVDTSPRKIRERRQAEPVATEDDDDDSGIVHVKSPQQLKADKERREQEELDKITGPAIR